MAKLVDRERLAKLAAALDARAKAAVQTEKERAMAAEKALQDAIDAINNGDNGILAEAKAYADQQVEAEANRAKGVEDDHEDRIKANEAFVAAQPAVDQAQDERMDGLEDRIEANEAFVAAQPAVDQAQDDRLAALEEDIERLDGSVDVEGSVKKQIADAIAEVNGDAEALEARVKANEDNIAAMDAEMGVPAEGENAATGMYKVIADGDAKALEDAKAYADQQITALVDSAPDAMNTLNELAAAIKENEGIYDAYVKEHAEAMTQMKADLQKEIDDSVAAEAKLREDADAALQEAVDAKVAQADYDAKVEALEAEDVRIAGLVEAEADRAKGVEDDHEDRIKANEAFVAAQPAVDQAQDDRLAALEAKFEGDESVAEQIADALQAAKDYADEKDAVVQGEVDALEAVVGKEAEGENAATGIFAKMAAMQADIDQNEADCDAAMQAEVEARNQAIADALVPYSTTEEVKTILGNVVATLNLSMVDDKVVLKLGGAEGIAISEVSLDLATDEDIDAMIAELDASAEE